MGSQVDIITKTNKITIGGAGYLTPHALYQHTDASGLVGAADGDIIKRSNGEWVFVTPDYLENTSVAGGIISQDITNWNAAYQASHSPVTLGVLANGLSLDVQELQMAAAGIGQPGVVTIGSQVFQGDKSLGQNGNNPTNTATQIGSYVFSLKGKVWDGAAAIDSEFTLAHQSDTSQNNFPRLVGLLDGLKYLRVDKSTESVTYVGLGHTTLGYRAGNAMNSSAYHNVLIGGHAGQSITSGYQNTALGSRALVRLTTGFENTAIGQGSFFECITGNYNTGLGFHSGLNNLGSGNTFLGFASGQSKSGATGSNNTGFGMNSLVNLNAGSTNTAIGRNALQALTDGTSNTAVGEGAGFSLTTGNENVFVGYRAGYTNTGGNATTTGIRNVFIGYESGSGTASQLTGAIAIGYRAKVTSDNTIVLGSTTIVGVVIGDTLADPSSILDIKSASKGILTPRMTTATFKAIASKAAGLEAFSSDDGGKLWYDGTRTIGFKYSGTKFQGYDGTNWIDLN